MTDLHDIDGMELVRRRLRLDPHRLKRLRVAFYKNRRDAEVALAEVPAEVRDQLREAVAFHHLKLVESVDSKIDGATKIVFETGDGLRLETVILRVRSGRTALCLSSQVGCAADCAFCATGKLGLRRNLTAGEILDQVVQANLLLASEDRRVRNIVFMGMGEPFHNETALFETLEALIHSECFHHAPSRISISTVGIPEGMLRCARRFPRVRIALSLHSARDTVRRRIIPLAERTSLTELRATIAEVARIQGQPVMLEYLMLDGINDSEVDRAALAEWAGDLPVHINLIPYNPIAGAPDLHSTEKPAREAFGNALKAQGFTVTLRYSLGADVTAACGQLVRAENQRPRAT